MRRKGGLRVFWRRTQAGGHRREELRREGLITWNRIWTRYSCKRMRRKKGGDFAGGHRREDLGGRELGRRECGGRTWEGSPCQCNVTAGYKTH